MRVDSFAHIVKLVAGLGVLCFSGLGCGQGPAIQTAGWDVLQCSTHTGLSCAGQAAAKCGIAEPNESGFDDYAACLAVEGKNCALNGFARCAIAGAVSVVGTLVAAGGAGCQEQLSDAALRACVVGKKPSTKADSVAVASSCYVEICMD